MRTAEARHRLVRALLQAEGPFGLPALAAQSGVPEDDLTPLLQAMVNAGQVVAGDLTPGQPGPQYRWAGYWEELARTEARDSRRSLTTAVDAAERLPAHLLTIDCDDVVAFHRYIIDEYAPPKDKSFLVFFQCSVRRPFSKSPSHAPMRRAIAVATGADPAKEFETCPIHVVVLASRIGPVPYELEDTYPANVGSGGVKHFAPDHYARVRPVLARRMAEYMTSHGERYRQMAAFADGRYAEVLKDAQTLAGIDFPVLPDKQGVAVTCMGTSRPRTYWAKYWIQLYNEIVPWLAPAVQRDAATRLTKLEVEWG